MTKRWINTRVVSREIAPGVWFDEVVEGFWHDGPVAKAHNVENLVQTHFRFTTDTGTIDSISTWEAGEDTNISVDVSSGDVPFRLRVNLQENGGADTGNNSYILYASINGGTYALLSSSSTAVQGADVSSTADNSKGTTQYLGGSGTYAGDWCLEIGPRNPGSGWIVANGCGEVDCGCKLIAADLSDGDTIDLQIKLSGGSNISGGYAVIPRITVRKSTAAGGYKNSSVCESNQGDGSLVVAEKVDVAVGDLAIVTVQTNANGDTYGTLSDNLGNTFTALYASTDVGSGGTQGSFRSYYSIIDTAGALDVYASSGMPTNTASVFVHVFAGGISAIDANVTPTADSSAPYVTGSSGTLTQADELIFAALNVRTGVTPPFITSVDTGYIVHDQASQAANGKRQAVAWKTVSATTAQTASFNSSTSTDTAVWLATFTLSSSGDHLTASDLAVSSPSIGTPSIGQTHNLTASDLAVSSPNLGTPAIAQTHDLSANGLAVSSPSLGTPTLAATTILTANDLAVSSLQIGSPQLGQEHALSTSGLAVSSPAIGSPSLGQEHALSATGITTSSPQIGTPAIGQVQALDANGLAVGSPTFGTPDISEANALAASDITVGALSIGSPSIGQGHNLAATDLVVGSPSLGTPTLAEAAYNLTANDLSVGSPTLGTSTLSEFSTLSASDVAVGSPVLGTPALGQEHALTGSNLAVSSPVLGSPYLSSMMALPLSVGPLSIGTPALGQVHALTASDLAVSSPNLATPSLSGIEELTASDLVVGSPQFGSPAVAEVASLSATDLAVASPSLGSPSVGQVHNLTAAELQTSAVQLGAPNLAQLQYLNASDLAVSSPILGTPICVAVGAIRVLTPLGITVGSPLIPTPLLQEWQGFRYVVEQQSQVRTKANRKRAATSVENLGSQVSGAQSGFGEAKETTEDRP